MRVPIRKPGKYTGLKSDPHMTRGKYEKLKARLERLKKVERPPAIEDVKEQAAFGDFSENAAYSIAKGKLRGINDRVIKIEGYIKNAIIIDERPQSNTVQLGSTVTVEINNRIRTYKILGSAEIDIARGIISHNSPIGSALIGRRPGEAVTIKIKDKTVQYKILEIN